MAKHPAKVETKIEIEKEEIEVQTITLTKEQFQELTDVRDKLELIGDELDDIEGEDLFNIGKQIGKIQSKVDDLWEKLISITYFR